MKNLTGYTISKKWYLNVHNFIYYEIFQVIKNQCLQIFYYIQKESELK